jgi:hypothetical protein
MEETPNGPTFFVNVGIHSRKEDHSFIPESYTLPNGVNVKINIEETGPITAQPTSDPFRWGLW